MFFHWEDEIPFSGKSDDLLWATADWPQNGWAGSESTPAPTCVSPGVGLGSKKGAHLGLGGATIGVDSSAWPSNDLTGGGVLGMLGYTGIGASGLGCVFLAFDFCWLFSFFCFCLVRGEKVASARDFGW